MLDILSQEVPRHCGTHCHMLQASNSQSCGCISVDAEESGELFPSVSLCVCCTKGMQTDCQSQESWGGHGCKIVQDALSLAIKSKLSRLRESSRQIKFACTQVQSLKQASLSPSTWASLKKLLQSKGMRGLFAGLSINYLKVVPSTAVGFTVYDAMKAYLGLPQNL